MSVGKAEYSARGKSILVPTCNIQGREMVAVGRALRIASIKDEDWLDLEPIVDLNGFTSALRASGLGADILQFAAPIDGAPLLEDCPFEMDNIAVIPTENYQAWWEGLPQEARRNARLASKRGIEVRPAPLDDAFFAGVKALYDETPIRQGRKFWHYGKDLESVRRENSTYADRSEFLGAYYLGELVGFVKFVYVGDVSRIMQILCLNAHQDKRPMTALIVAAAQICHQNHKKYLIYGKFNYGKKENSSITEFKRRLGFRKLEFRRYYAPLTTRGWFGFRLGLHKGVAGLLPAPLLEFLLGARAWWLESTLRRRATQA